jgi:hypothetical protein
MGSFINFDKSDRLSMAKKGVKVAAFNPMLLGKIGVEGLQTIQGSGIYHGLVW